MYVGNVILSYPDRTLNLNANFSNEGPYDGNVKISWSADESIDVVYSVGSDFVNQRKLWAFAKVETPFTGWKNNKVNGSFYNVDNLVSLSIDTIFAETQEISTQFLIDYLLAEQEFFYEVKTGIQSTIKDIPIVTAYVKHNQTSTAVLTEMLFKHKNFVSDEFRTFSIKSSFKRSVDQNHRNVSGSIKFKSPFENYNSGAIITKFSLTKDRELFGVFDMDIDSRIYTFALEGYMKKLFDNMITFNLTTPSNGFGNLLGKFGIVEVKRYLIADLKTANRSVGIEVLFDFHSITDFDLKFYVATPQAAFEKILVVGKLKEDYIHLEGQWNKIKLGFKGIWQFLEYNNFEYCYMIFTPLLNFEENGIVFKFIAQSFQTFDVESSFKLGKYKIGLKAFGEPHTQLINQLGLQKASYIRDESLSQEDLDDNTELTQDVKVDFDPSNFFNVIGNFEICYLMVAKPITGKYEVQQIDEAYIADATIYTPNGIVSIRNKFVMKEHLDFKNRLSVNTPFTNYETLSSNFVFKVPPSGLITRFDVGSSNGNRSVKYGFKLSYLLLEQQTYDLKIVILYPLNKSSRINVNFKIQFADDSLQYASFDLEGFNTVLSMAGESKVFMNS